MARKQTSSTSQTDGDHSTTSPDVPSVKIRLYSRPSRNINRLVDYLVPLSIITAAVSDELLRIDTIDEFIGYVMECDEAAGSG